MTVALEQLPDALLAHVLSWTADARALGRAACCSHRLRRVVLDPRGLAWRRLRRGPDLSAGGDLALRPISAHGLPADGARAVAVAEGHVLFASAESELVLQPSAQDSVPLKLRDAPSWSGARPGDAVLAVRQNDDGDARRSSFAIAARGAALPRGARSTRVRNGTLAGRSRHTLRVGGFVSAVAVEEDTIAIGRKGSGTVQLWHAERAELLAEIAARAEVIAITSLALHGALLLSCAADGSIAVHAIGAASAGKSRAGAAGGERAGDDVRPQAFPRVLHIPGAPGWHATCAALSGHWLAAGGADAKVRVWVMGGCWLLATWEAHRASICAVRVARDCVLSASVNGEIRVWDVTRGQCLRHVQLPSGAGHFPAQSTAGTSGGERLLDVGLCPRGIVCLGADGLAWGLDWDPRGDDDGWVPRGDGFDAAVCPPLRQPLPADAGARDEADFSVARVGQHFSGFASRVAGDAPEYMAAVLRCVTSKLLQGAGEAAREGEAARIEPRHIWQAVQHDGELASLAADRLQAGECHAPVDGASSAGRGEPSGGRV